MEVEQFEIFDAHQITSDWLTEYEVAGALCSPYLTLGIFQGSALMRPLEQVLKKLLGYFYQ